MKVENYLITIILTTIKGKYCMLEKIGSGRKIVTFSYDHLKLS